MSNPSYVSTKSPHSVWKLLNSTVGLTSASAHTISQLHSSLLPYPSSVPNVLPLSTRTGTSEHEVPESSSDSSLDTSPSIVHAPPTSVVISVPSRQAWQHVTSSDPRISSGSDTRARPTGQRWSVEGSVFPAQYPQRVSVQLSAEGAPGADSGRSAGHGMHVVDAARLSVCQPGGHSSHADAASLS